MAKQFERKPLGRREAKIIKRMRAVARLPVSKIAEVVQRNKTSVYTVLSGDARFAKRGAKSKLTPKILTPSLPTHPSTELARPPAARSHQPAHRPTSPPNHPTTHPPNNPPIHLPTYMRPAMVATIINLFSSCVFANMSYCVGNSIRQRQTTIRQFKSLGLTSIRQP
jgi:hypothetical protein